MGIQSRQNAESSQPYEVMVSVETPFSGVPRMVRAGIFVCVPTADGALQGDVVPPNVEKGGFLCPKLNFGDNCPVCLISLLSYGVRG